MVRLTNKNIQMIENDQEAINAAYQVADFALEGRNERDQKQILPFAEIDLFSQRGLGAIRIAQKYGGAFVSNKTLAHVFRIINKADSSLGQIPQNQIALLNVIDLIGSHEQKTFVFNEILQGKRLANGGPEKNTKDTKTLSTLLTVQNEHYILNGEKFYSTGSSFADWLAIKAIHPEGHIVLAIVDKNTQGIEVINDWNGFGQRTTSSGSVKLTNVKVDPFLIFDERKLLEQPTTRGAYSQLLQVAIDVGIAEAAFADTLTAIHKARPILDSGFDKASQEHYTLQDVGKLNVLLDAAILLLDEAAEYLDELDQIEQITEQQAAKASILVAEAKVYAHDAALNISEKLIELGGSRSSLKQHNLDQHWRNARVHTLHDPIRWKLHALGEYYLNNKLPAKHSWI